MCGLFASVGFDPDMRRIDIVAHRGPDGRGWEIFDSAAGPVALGHRRLAIIDVSDAGLQPMADRSGRYHLVFNGEIYNYIELREELAARGERFETDSDSEVLLRAFIVWGDDCLTRLRGMFAFLIWDAHQRRLFAARDRYGIKPLYVYEGGGGIAFGSEIKQLLGLPGLSGRMNVARVHDFLISGNADHTDETMFAQVRQVRAGECVSIDCSSGHPIAEGCRWYPAIAGELALSEQEAAERFHDLLNTSVRLHLRSDVTVGSCLSGGLDSSAIVCLMARELGSGAAINTVSACYAEKEVDERPFMESVAKATGVHAHYVFPRADDVFQRAHDITWHQDEPFGSTSIFSQWCVFEEARKAGVKVMLDGQGADEQLAGYHGSFFYRMSDLQRRGKLASLVRTIAERRYYHGTPMSGLIRQHVMPLLPPGGRALIAPWLQPPEDQLPSRNWLGSALIREQGNPKGGLALGMEMLDLPPLDDLRSLCLALTYAGNVQMLLHWEDRNSMAHSIEARVPFLDHPLVEFSLALGNEHKMVGGDTKRVMRRAMRGILPRDVRERRDKLGFATPEQRWFRGPLREMVISGINETLDLYPDLFDRDETIGHMNEMLDGRRTVDFSLWRIINLGIWGKMHNVTI